MCAVNDNENGCNSAQTFDPIERERIYNQVTIHSVININIDTSLLKVSTLHFFIKHSQTWRVSHQTGAARDERDESGE